LIAVTFTSGTTGLPKGCMIDHAWALRATDVALTVHAYGPEDRIFYPVKFFYMDAPMALMRVLACGGAFVAARAFSVSRFWAVVRSQRVTILSTIASMPAWLLKAPPRPDDREHGVRFAIQAHIAPELHAAMDERWGFPWLENYGMTEAGLIARVPVELADRVRATGSAGPPAPGVELRILGEDDADVPPGTAGEILVRQPGMFRGYLGLPEATAELFHEGWIRTGDLGVLDANGYVSVVGRKKDMIRRSGENISAAEVESVLASHPRVLEAAVIGVPDIDRGEEVKAFVQLVDGAAREEAPPAQLVGFCAERLAPHKVPRFVQFVDELPRTATLRVRKQLLRDAAPGGWDRAAAGEEG
jgi:crotonobetaine/carnitine-CoA ligase